MVVPPTDVWLSDAQAAHAAESPRWQYVFGRYDAARLGAGVLIAQRRDLLSNGFEIRSAGDAAIIVGPRDYRQSTFGAVRHGTARAALAGGMGALRRLNETTAAYQRLSVLVPSDPATRIVAQRLGDPAQVLALLARVPTPIRVITSRHEEVELYLKHGLQLRGQDAVGATFTAWLLDRQPSSLSTRRP